MVVIGGGKRQMQTRGTASFSINSGSRSALEAGVRLASRTVISIHLPSWARRLGIAAHPTPESSPCMPRFDALNSSPDVNPWLTGQSEGSGLKRVILVGLALLFAGAAAAQELKSPRISVAKVDWDAAAASIVDRPAGTPAEVFAKLNAAADISFPKIADSSVPVLLPYDVDAFIKDRAANPEPPPEKAVENADRFMRSGFRPTKFFVTGPAGYDSAFALTLADVRELSDIRYADPVYVLFSGLAMTYELDGPAIPDGELVKSLQDEYPGIRRYLHKDSYIRYSFERFGATYVAAIYCLDTRPRSKILTCKQADRVMERFLRALKLAEDAGAGIGKTRGACAGPSRRNLEGLHLFQSRLHHSQHRAEERHSAAAATTRSMRVCVSRSRRSGLRKFTVVQQLGRL